MEVIETPMRPSMDPENRVRPDSNEIDAPQLSVAICIGTYNQAQYLRGSVESAVKQTYPIQEIWVSDDASTDNTDSVMREIRERWPQVRYFRQPTNLGLPGNISWLLAQPKTDLVVRLDSDDCLEPDYAAVLSKLMQQYPEAGYAHCDVTDIDGDGNPRRVRRLARTAAYEPAEQALKGNASGYRAAANCILYRAKAIEQVDYYRPTISWRYCEDWDMIVRLAMAGWGNVYAPRRLSNYRVWDDGKGVRASRKMAEVRETAEIYKARLIPEYAKRGWSIAPLKKHMRGKAVGYAEAIDSPNFTAEDREEYKRLLMNLGDSPQLKLAIRMADMGFNPVVRFWARTRIGLKDQVKRGLRAMRAR
jgi:glycosyltransferase involved in cell wall biosynthesis